jgi:uncharacterized protein YndB with AHSA1/START domain
MTIRFTSTVEIARPAEDVFAYLSDLEHVPEWNWAISRTEPTTEARGSVGAVYRQTRHTPSPAIEFVEITALEPNRHLQVSGDLGPFKAVLDYHLESDESKTTLRNDVALESGKGMSVLARAFRRRVASSVATNLDSLRKLLEQK